MRSEFDLIKQYFSRTTGTQAEGAVSLGVADDCAIFSNSPGTQIATSKDLLIEGHHFFADVDPYALGHKALAVNLSDLAAMGAKPIACLLGLALPSINEEWLSAFAKGFYDLADEVNCPLIGGDTTRSLQGITLSVTVFGEVSPPYLLRSNAQVGDTIWVSGYLGEAHVALELLQAQKAGQSLSLVQQTLLQSTRRALEYPQPRIALGRALASQRLAHAAIDISDGLLQDLGHILEQSGVSAVLHESALPVRESLLTLSQEQRLQAVLAGGDVYELCFTAPADAAPSIWALAQDLSLPLTPIGEIVPAGKELVTVLDARAFPLNFSYTGFDHFAM